MNKDPFYFNATICTLAGLQHNMDVKAVLCLFKCDRSMNNRYKYDLNIGQNNHDYLLL